RRYGERMTAHRVVQRALAHLLARGVVIGDAEVREVVPPLAGHCDVDDGASGPFGNANGDALRGGATSGDAHGSLGTQQLLQRSSGNGFTPGVGRLDSS